MKRLATLGIERDVSVVPCDLHSSEAVAELVSVTQPDEIYNLAAPSHIGVSFESPLPTSDVAAMGVLRLLEACRRHSPHTRFYQASTGEMFAPSEAQSATRNEGAPFRPCSPYGVAKLFAHWMTVNYRELYGLFACTGMLFNHESPLRGEEFVTRKVTLAVARIRGGYEQPLRLGNLDTKRDWGYAAEYVEAMWRIVNHDQASDFVVATGVAHSVREWVERAFEVAGIPIAWEGQGLGETGRRRDTGKVVVEISKEFYRPADAQLLLGDATRARTLLGWTPQTTFESLVAIMVEADIRLATDGQH